MTQASYRVAVLMGGASAEASVSRNSAQQVAQALRAKGHTTHTVELDDSCVETLITLNADVVFPALHGPPGEDGTVQGLLTMLGVPFVGSDVRGSALAMDKAVAKHIFRHHALPVSNDIVVGADTTDIAQTTQQIVRALGERIVIKPLNQGSAIGVIPLPDGGDIAGALTQTLALGACLVEPFIVGKEITVGVLETDNEVVPHPVIEILTANEQWYDYENRYTPGQSEHLIPASCSTAVQGRLQSIAVAAHQALGLSDLSRADFIVTADEDIYLLEVNTLPGMTQTSLYPEGAAAIGYGFADLIDHLVQRAVRRGPR